MDIKPSASMRRGLGANNKIVESEGSRSRNLGFAMTEKGIDERVSRPEISSFDRILLAYALRFYAFSTNLNERMASDLEIYVEKISTG